MASQPAPAPTPVAAGSDRPLVGAQVRHWRLERGMTLARVAERSGLNVGYLSQIENDKATPSLEALAAIGRALEVPIAWFLIDRTSPPTVVRAAERRSWPAPGGNGVVTEVDGGIPRDLRIVEVTAQPGGSTGFHAHRGNEHHVVISGRLRATQGDHSVDLGPGDYLLWDASVPHDAGAIGDEPCVLLIITSRAHSEDLIRPE